mmetsp:Transcript_21174/g.66453  ORF Transcript_21174/g.66453 Transcript_21174/m.66453 type:complete len:313 (-) Transcript_21174:351-1289(-)
MRISRGRHFTRYTSKSDAARHRRRATPRRTGFGAACRQRCAANNNQSGPGAARRRRRATGSRHRAVPGRWAKAHSNFRRWGCTATAFAARACTAGLRIAGACVAGWRRGWTVPAGGVLHWREQRLLLYGAGRRVRRRLPLPSACAKLGRPLRLVFSGPNVHAGSDGPGRAGRRLRLRFRPFAPAVGSGGGARHSRAGIRAASAGLVGAERRVGDHLQRLPTRARHGRPAPARAPVRPPSTAWRPVPAPCPRHLAPRPVPLGTRVQLDDTSARRLRPVGRASLSRRAGCDQGGDPVGAVGLRGRGRPGGVRAA